MKDIWKAQNLVVRVVTPLGSESIHVDEALGRVLMNEMKIEGKLVLNDLENSSSNDLKLISPLLQAELKKQLIEKIDVKRKATVIVLVPEVETFNQRAEEFLRSRLGQLNAVVKIVPAESEIMAQLDSAAENQDAILIIDGDRKELLKAIKSSKADVHFTHLDSQTAGRSFAADYGGKPLLWSSSEFADIVVAVELILAPAVINMQQVCDEPSNRIKAELKAEIPLQEDVTQFVPGISKLKAGVYQVRPVEGWQENMERALIFANCLIVADPEQFVLDHHSIVDIISLSRGLML
jgi:molybdopterin biosynthesis enzyme